MPAFPHDGPVRVVLDIASGDVRIVAVPDGDRASVGLRPADPAKKGDVQAAERAEVSFADGVLRVSSAGTWRSAAIFGGGSQHVDIEIEVPAGSRVQGATRWGFFETEGELGTVDVRSSGGNLRIDRADGLTLHAAAGEIAIGRATGRIALSSAAGTIRARELAGEATVKNANGQTSIGRSDGDLTVNGAHAAVEILRARGRVTAKTASGSITVERADGGQLRLETSYGSIGVGVAAGTPTWLDIASEHGQVRSSLEAADQPAADEAEPLEIRARSTWGDVRIHRADD
ncbi:DUF4097 family beta strand repeat-containing protein [Agromyces archimandritae]|uniref:DUF4097 family beta strand repeat protein n=1 Tax=Agromyces archimandritae TaxID=2781962 RepID=A0A975IPH6_9MICO|nr:DUF4097 family beta strand repeat-containing protein [Agromyces archimandritae]QTX04011.1 DUF4097 family beta strand repeat protein [Agromyces archimandritae]